MKRCFSAPSGFACIALASLWLSSACATRAQNRVAKSRVVTITPRNLAELPQLAAGADALEIDVSREQLEARPQSWNALEQWVREGGIALLHTDAAQLFGYITMAARERTEKRAGQRFGRAHNALFFGQHPLLWNGLSRSLDGATFGSMGVRRVFYQMAPGDHFALAHHEGVPILRVGDLALPELGLPSVGESELIRALGFNASLFREPLSAQVSRDGTWPLLVRYAVAMAPHGRGWTIVAPRAIETQRGDGAVFLQNMDALIFSLRRDKTWVALPIAPLQRAMDRIKRSRRVDWARVAQEIRDALQSTSAEWSEDDVREMFARDRDQTLAPEEVKSGFRPQRWPKTGERELYMAIANSIETRKRKRLLSLAHRKFKLLITQRELDDLLQDLEEAAADQKEARFQPELLAPEDETEALADQNQAPQSDERAANGEAGAEVAADGGAETDAHSETPLVPLQQDERKSPSYRRAAGLMFWFDKRSALHSDAPDAGRRAWLNVLRERGLARDKAWLWRGLLSAATCDNHTIHAYGRLTFLNDAIASWQRALQARLERLQKNDVAATMNAADTAPFASGLAGELADQSTLNALSGADDTRDERAEAAAENAERAADLSRELLQGEIAGVPCALIGRWISDGLKARTLIAREPPFGGARAPGANGVRIAGVKVGTDNLDEVGLSTVGKGSSPDRDGPGDGLFWRPLSGGATHPMQVAIRGFLEHKSENYRVRASLLGRKPDMRGRYDISGLGPLSDKFRADFIRDLTGAVAFHGGRRELGWGLDRLDVLLFPGGASALSFARQSARVAGLGSPLPSDGSFVAQGTLGQVHNVSPVVSPLGVARTMMLQSATEGRVVGTRLMLSTALPDGLNHSVRLSRRQVRRAAGVPAAIARLQAQALLNTITEGGAAPPAWMSEGLANMCRMYMASALTNALHPARSFLHVGGTSSVSYMGRNAQGQVVSGSASGESLWWVLLANDRTQVDEPNAIWWSSEVDYFRTAAEIVMLDNPDKQPSTLALQALYKKIGPGGVTEILQRLGSGQIADEAFEAVTGMSEKECLAMLAKAA